MGAGEVVTAQCRNCGHTIGLGHPTPDPYWYHLHTNSVYCWLTTERPEERNVRAEPTGG